MRLIGKLTPKLSLYGTISKTAEIIGSNIQPLTVRNNGTYEASNGVDGFNPVYVNTPEPKEEQEKTVDITENGTTEVLPDENKVFSKVIINSNVPDTSDIIKDIIDNSGVLDSTEGSVEDKVEKLIDLAQWENFWYERSGKWTDQFEKLFLGTGTDKVPKLNFENATNIGYLFYGCPIESVDYYINSSKITTLNGVFASCKKLKSIVGIDVSNCITAGDWLYNSTIEVIEEPLDFSNCTKFSQTFHNVRNLREVYFVPECLKASIVFGTGVLSADSIQSIIDGLATVSTAQTLTLNKAISLTDEQKATINAKGWTLAQ